MEPYARHVTLVRHGRTSYNRQGLVQGSIDIPLDEVGLWQVNQSAQSLIELYVLPDPSRHQLVVSSDLERSMQTAHAFADRLGVEVHADERLRERHFGEFEGRSGAYLQANFPQDFDSWCRGMGGEMNHGAESHEHAGARGMEAMNDWAHECDDDTDLFVFSHGALIENALQVLFGIERRYPDFLSLTSMRNAHWARLRRANIGMDSRWIMEDYNHGPALADTQYWERPDTLPAK